MRRAEVVARVGMKRAIGWDDNRRELSSTLRGWATWVAIAAILDLATWRSDGALRLVLAVPAAVATLAAAWTTFFYGTLAWAFLAATHPTVGAIAFGAVFGLALFLVWWAQSGDVPLALVIGMVVGAAAGLSMLGMRRGSGRQGPRRS